VESPPLVVEARRGGIVEARHVVHAVAVRDGAVVAMAGDPSLTCYLRSSSKPLQALALARARTDADARDLAEALLSTSEAAAGYAERVVNTSGGNPLFLEELAASVAERTADVVAETPVVVRRLRAASLERMTREDPALATALHRWLARTMAERLTHTQSAVQALVD
jgi:L-asparaginase II